jgi:hypothetical protein
VRIPPRFRAATVGMLPAGFGYRIKEQILCLDGKIARYKIKSSNFRYLNRKISHPLLMNAAGIVLGSMPFWDSGNQNFISFQRVKGRYAILD